MPENFPHGKCKSPENGTFFGNFLYAIFKSFKMW